MKDIAVQAGCSVNAVSLALRNDRQISEKLKARIHEIAKDLGYQRNHAVGEVMTQMRLRGAKGTGTTLALMNANINSNALKDHPTVPTYTKGCTERANSLGYNLDTFWLYDEKIKGERLKDILISRGIRGVLLVGMMKQNRLPESFMPVIKALPCVLTGVRSRQPSLSFAAADHYMLTLRALENVIKKGYKRPALVLDRDIESLVEGRFSAGFQRGQENLPIEDRIPPFYDVKEAMSNPDIFKKWLESNKPDIIFTLYNNVLEWVRDCGYRVPEDIGLAQIDWRESEPDWAGMNQHSNIIGQAAVEMLISMIHHGEKGIPEFPRATLIGSTWVDGKTLIDKTEAT